MLLAAGVLVGEGVRRANARVELLSALLHQQTEQDRAQEHLRLAIGNVTRTAEKASPLSAGDWAQVSAEISRFHQLVSSNSLAPSALPNPVASAVSRAQIAARLFVPSCRELVEVARTRPGSIKATMPRFLGTLKRLEEANMAARQVVASEISSTIHTTAYESERNILSVLAAGAVVFAIVFWMTIWLRAKVLIPIASIAASIRDFDESPADATLPALDRPDELGDLARGLANYRASVDGRRAANERAEFLAHHDGLTGLANRLLFEDRLTHELARAGRTGDRVAVFAIDIDNFKAINDRQGHAGGDRALQRMAKLLTDCVRSDDLVARLGGDEFAIIQVAACQPEGAEALSARLLRATTATTQDDAGLRISIGIAVFEPELASENLYDLADLALYRAKAAGRNTVRFFDNALREQESLRLRLARDLEQALSAGELHLAYQPIADAQTLEIKGYEALLRWQHPTLGDVPPERFIPIAEGAGLIDVIGLWVADRAMAAAATWGPHLSLSLNLSPIQFRRTGLAERLLKAAKRHALSADRLEFEVTESATLLGFQRDEVLSALKALQSAGALVTMDDFGTGHSSLSNLKDFTFDKLKIDRSFVAAMSRHIPSASIVKATIGLGKSLGLTIVAEGVEEEAQLLQLRRWGCDQVQGYLVGRPAPDVPQASAQVYGE